MQDACVSMCIRVYPCVWVGSARSKVTCEADPGEISPRRSEAKPTTHNLAETSLQQRFQPWTVWESWCALWGWTMGLSRFGSREVGLWMQTSLILFVILICHWFDRLVSYYFIDNRLIPFHFQLQVDLSRLPSERGNKRKWVVSGVRNFPEGLRRGKSQRFQMLPKAWKGMKRSFFECDSATTGCSLRLITAMNLYRWCHPFRQGGASFEYFSPQARYTHHVPPKCGCQEPLIILSR